MTTASNEDISRLRKKLENAIASIMDWYNLTHSASELYSYMFFEDKPMTLEEMKVVMGMSKSNMSYAVRSLVNARMIYKLDYKEGRKELFRADPDFLSSFKNFLTSKLEREISVVTDTLEEVLPRLREISDKRDLEEHLRQDANRYLNKALHAKDYYQWLQEFVDKLNSENLK
ncbi:GbsR/MarR family transcriptional regulator [Alicyclobacillus sp. SO9]|uniref:GbsR/MarR family transcriptional regulator n=1 Tax=Alicyclobacillus sp. SO9 TaxID=2665646 RepID=UPI0018E8CAF6|nr:transcriptional regulator [Alicyclobacillus sp. SO9]QQE79821.1 transcriptional regulator [Alicyclobacillus sp. SO9]